MYDGVRTEIASIKKEIEALKFSIGLCNIIIILSLVVMGISIRNIWLG